MNAASDSQDTAAFAEARTRAWVNRAVIGLNLCPFAKAPQVKGLLRYVVSPAAEPEALLATLCDELRLLAEADPERIETTLIVHPGVLNDFEDYNDFLGAAEAAVAMLGYDGLLQVASFHPDYQFAGTERGDVTNASNRSPYPTLHLLREESIDRAVAAFPDASAIFETNMVTLESLGAAGWADLQAQCWRDAQSGRND